MIASVSGSMFTSCIEALSLVDQVSPLVPGPGEEIDTGMEKEAGEEDRDHEDEQTTDRGAAALRRNLLSLSWGHVGMHIRNSCHARFASLPVHLPLPALGS